MFGLIGPDGAGKTTTIRLDLRAAARRRGQRPRARTSIRCASTARLTGSVGYLSQRFSLYGDLSIDENIAFFAEIHGVRDYRARRDRLLEMTQLAPFRSRLADRLSGGMKQKLALACTLVHEPALIVLDEPTTGVDPVSRREFWKLLSEFLSQGITIVMATPYLDEAERCTRVALLHEGRLLALDRPDALRATLPGALFEVIVADHRRAPDVLARIPGVTGVQMFGERAHVLMDRADAAADTLAVGACARRARSVASVRPLAASLEDVFIAQAPSTSRDGFMKPTACAAWLSSGGRCCRRAALAQPADAAPLQLTLDEAIRARPRDEPPDRGSDRARRGCRGAVGERHAATLPQLSRRWPATRARTTSRRSASCRPNNQLRIIYPDVPDNYRTRLDVQWPIYTGGRLDALERAARIEATASADEIADRRAAI